MVFLTSFYSKDVVDLQYLLIVLHQKRQQFCKRKLHSWKNSPDSTNIEADNDIKRYLKRPRALENWCLADYISQLEVIFPKTTQEGSEELAEDKSDNED